MKSSSDKPIELTLFSVIGHVFAIDQEFLIEVLESTSASQLPFVPDFVDGLINVNGQILPQVDLASLVYGSDYEKPINNKFHTVLVVSIDGVTLALRVGQVQETLSIIESDIIKSKPVKKSKKTKSSKKDQQAEYTLGTFDYNNGQITLLDVEALKDIIKADKTSSGKQGFLGKVAESKHDEEKFQGYLIVEVSGNEYAFSLSDVYEINVLDVIYSQPRAPVQVAGVSLIREEPRLILNLSELIGEKHQEVVAGSVVMIQSGDVFCGLLIGKLLGLEMISEHQVKVDKEKSLRTILRDNGNSLTKVINVNNLFDSKIQGLIRPYMPDQKSMDEKVVIKQVEMLRFEVGGSAYGINVNKIHRVVSDKSIEPLLSKHGCIMGTMELEGRVVPVINLFEQLGYSTEDAVYRECIVVNDGESDWGLIINETDQIVKIDENRIDAVNDKDMKYVSAFSSYNGSLLTILNVNAICKDNRKTSVVSG